MEIEPQRLAHLLRVNDGHMESVDLVVATEKEADGRLIVERPPGSRGKPQDALHIPVKIVNAFVLSRGEFQQDYIDKLNQQWEKIFLPK